MEYEKKEAWAVLFVRRDEIRSHQGPKKCVIKSRFRNLCTLRFELAKPSIEYRVLLYANRAVRKLKRVLSSVKITFQLNVSVIFQRKSSGWAYFIVSEKRRKLKSWNIVQCVNSEDKWPMTVILRHDSPKWFEILYDSIECLRILKDLLGIQTYRIIKRRQIHLSVSELSDGKELQGALHWRAVCLRCPSYDGMDNDRQHDSKLWLP
jgi:hypothetical protein